MVISLSSEEGFNLPLLQGIMNKKIIIASNIPIHQEIYPYIPLVSLTSPQKASQDILKNILE
ncbi:MAG: hypothetical protein U9Q15_02280 [Patescibacteria group bacterium]|nr:hypothetical protein [Patescibacteria group bacterium]